jgi:hypothetical protein
MADILAAHLAEKLAPGEVRQGFRAISITPRRPDGLYAQPTMVLVDERGRMYGDRDLYVMNFAQPDRGRGLRWATPEERVAAGDRLQHAIAEHIAPAERDARSL